MRRKPNATLKILRRFVTKPEIDRAFSEAILFQQQNRTSEAIEKWRSFANIIEGTDDEREAQAWFSIGYLSSTRDEPDLDAAINAYDAALRLNPSNAEALQQPRGSEEEPRPT